MIQLPTVHTKHYGHALHAARYFLGPIESGRATYISCNGYYNQLTGAPFLSCPFLTVIPLHPFLGRGLLPPSMYLKDAGSCLAYMLGCFLAREISYSPVAKIPLIISASAVLLSVFLILF